MRLRLIIYFVIIVLVTISSMLFIATVGTANEVRSYMFRGGMYGTSKLVKALQAHYQAVGSWQGIEAVFTPVSQGHGMGSQGWGQGMGGMMNQHLILTDADGKIIADSRGTVPSGVINPSGSSQKVPIEVGTTTVGYLFTEGGMVFSEADETFLIGRLTRAALLAGLIAGGLSLFLALILAYRLLRPVQELTLAAQNLGQGDLSQRARIQGKDELAELGRTFNFMAQSLENAELSRKALTADIAHELRTPLAVQRANLEALQDGIFPLTTENLQPLLEQNQLLTRLVEDLRTLALVEGGQLELQCETTDFPNLVRKIVDRYQSQASSSGIQLSLHIDPSQNNIPAMMVDAMRVEQVITNLLSNAFRYTPINGRIELQLERVSNSLQLKVHDGGQGISAESLPFIFERFYRADRSRSRVEGGTGLGLAIARKLAEAHGGSLIAQNHPDGGAIFTFTLPLNGKNQQSGTGSTQ